MTEDKDKTVIRLADKSESALTWTPEDMLIDAVQNVCDGKFQGRKALVIFLDDSDNKYEVGFKNAGMRGSEIVSLVSAVKHIILRDMEL